MNQSLLKIATTTLFLISTSAQAAQLVCSARYKNAPTSERPLNKFIVVAPDIHAVYGIGETSVLAVGSQKKIRGSDSYTLLIFNHKPTTLDKGSWVRLAGYVDRDFLFTKIRVQAVQTNTYRVKIQGETGTAPEVTGDIGSQDGLSTLTYDTKTGIKVELNCEVRTY